MDFYKSTNKVKNFEINNSTLYLSKAIRANKIA